MKFGLDLRCLPNDGSEGAGVSHATRELCSRLVSNPSIEWIAFEPKGADFNVAQRARVVYLADGSGGSLRSAVRQNACDTLFVPSGAVPWGLGIPAIPWIHDLTILDHPEWFPESWLRRQYTTRLVLRGIKKAPVVFAVSEYTKAAIVRNTGIEAEKVVVTGEGGDGELARLSDLDVSKIKIQAAQFVKDKRKIESRYVLALGTVEPRKNLAMLIRAWYKTTGNRSLDLVVAGLWGWKCDDVRREISNLPSDLKKRFHRIEKLTDNDKRGLLMAASAVAVPSWEEGFGLVALEALQAGTPVVVSNRGALPEVVGDVGRTVDPGDEDAWANALIDVAASGKVERRKIFNSVGLAAAVDALRGKTSQSHLSKQGGIVFGKEPAGFSTADGFKELRQRASNFSWEKSAGIVLDNLRRLK